jgi:Flp pilus assembly protein CpaB
MDDDGAQAERKKKPSRLRTIDTRGDSENPMPKRSNLIVVLGVVVFVIGAAAAYLVVRNDNSSASAAKDTGSKVTVLVASKAIPSGTKGADAVNGGMVDTKQVDPSAKPAAALTDSSQLPGRTAQGDISQGQILTSDQFVQAQTAIGTIKIPDGKTALALSLSNVPGVAGFAGAGDKIDIFGVVKNAPNKGQATHLIMQGVDVLNVNGTTLAPNAGQPGGPGLVFLLAVTPAQAEHLIYLASFEQMYFSLLPKSGAPTVSTPGVGGADAFSAV